MELGSNYVIYTPTDNTMFNGVNLSTNNSISPLAVLNLKGAVYAALWSKTDSGLGTIYLDVYTPDGVLLDDNSLIGSISPSQDVVVFGQGLGSIFPVGDVILRVSSIRQELTNIVTYMYIEYGGTPPVPLIN